MIKVENRRSYKGEGVYVGRKLRDLQGSILGNLYMTSHWSCRPTPSSDAYDACAVQPDETQFRTGSFHCLAFGKIKTMRLGVNHLRLLFHLLAFGNRHYRKLEMNRETTF